MNYTTLASIKKKLWITNNDSDSELSLIIEQATALIDTELWVNLERKSIFERVDWTGVNRIYTKNKAHSIISIISHDWFTSYWLDYINGYILHLNEKTPKWKRNILVNYEIWFDEVPKDIEEICLNIWVVLADKQNIKWTLSTKLINKNIQTQKLWNLSITYFWDKERNKSSFEALDPNLNIEKVLNKYKPFTWLY